MSRTHPRHRFLQQVRAMNPVDAHNRLMRATDRDIAIALLFMADADAQLVLQLLAPPKAARIQAEIGRNRRARITQGHHEAALTVLMDHLAGIRNAGATRSYYRPSAER